MTAINVIWWGVGFWCGVFMAWVITSWKFKENYCLGLLREGYTKSGTKIKRSPVSPRPISSPPSQYGGYQPKAPEGYKRPGKPPQGGSGVGNIR